MYSLNYAAWLLLVFFASLALEFWILLGGKIAKIIILLYLLIFIKSGIFLNIQYTQMFAIIMWIT